MIEGSPQLPCLVCGAPLQVRLARGRRSGKAFLLVICPVDGRHFRGFVGDQSFVQQVADAAGGPDHHASQDP